MNERRTNNDSEAGCTSTTVLVTHDKVICANAGDSRTIVLKGGKVLFGTVDHKPDDELEKARIEAAGGKVMNGRVQGALALSRCLGDFEYKKAKDLNEFQQMCSCQPTVTEHDRAGIEGILLACDGVWDVRTNEVGNDDIRGRCYKKNDEEF